MSFDSTKPADHAPIVAAELRNQFNALQAQITVLQQQMTTLMPVLTANNTTMSLDWSYSGPACDRFHIFQHLPEQASGVFADWKQVNGDLRTCATDFDSPADAAGYKFYIVPEKGAPEDGEDKPVTSSSNTVNFAAG